MRVNILKNDSLPLVSEVISQENNSFTLSIPKPSNIKTGDKIIIAQSIDDMIFQFEAEVKNSSNQIIEAKSNHLDSFINSRSFPRKNISSKASIHFSNGETINVSILDISKFGMKIVCQKEFPRITSVIKSSDSSVVDIFGNNQKTKVIWRNIVDGNFVYGLQKVSVS